MPYFSPTVFACDHSSMLTPGRRMHIASGCVHPTMQKLHTERINKIGKRILKSIHKVDTGDHLKHADVGDEQNCTEDKGPWLGGAWAWLRSKSHPAHAFPDLILHMLSPQQIDHTILIELKTCRDTDLQGQMEATQQVRLPATTRGALETAGCWRGRTANTGHHHSNS
eukprot:363663-Chlamydomonas_euryale.AAC.3